MFEAFFALDSLPRPRQGWVSGGWIVWEFLSNSGRSLAWIIGHGNGPNVPRSNYLEDTKVPPRAQPEGLTRAEPRALSASYRTVEGLGRGFSSGVGRLKNLGHG